MAANDEIAYRFFRGKELPDFQAAAIVGNLLQENSTLNPRLTAREAGGYDAHGIAMWSPARWAALNAWAVANTLDVYDIVTQLGYVWQELLTVPSLGLSQLRASASIEEATLVFEKKFERPAPGSSTRRLQLATTTFNKYSGAPPLPPPSVAAKTTSSPFVTAIVIVAASTTLALAIKHGVFRRFAFG